MRGPVLAILLLGGLVSSLPAQQTNSAPQRPNWRMGGPHFDPSAMLEQISEQIVQSPADPQGYVRRARVYMMLGQYDEAIIDSSQAIQLSPNLLPAYFQMASAYKLDGLFNQAISTYDTIIQLNPRLASAYVNRGQAYKLAGDAQGNPNDYQQAIADYRSAMDLNGNSATAYNNLAWLEATCTNDTYRNAKDAIVNAQRACQLTRWHSRAQLDTLAAAYANAGDYADAVKWETKVTTMTSMGHMWGHGHLDPALLQQWKDRLALYLSHKPLRQAGDPPPPTIKLGTTAW